MEVMQIYELLIRGDKDTGITGWQASVFDEVGNIKPLFSSNIEDIKELIPSLFVGGGLEDSLELSILKSNIDDLNAEITQLKTRLSPAIHEITPQLLESGLLRWGQDAVSAVDSSTGELIMGLVLDLKAIAMEPPSLDQCDRIKELFGTIVTMSNVYPNSDQAKAMQALLDKGCPSTGPIAEQFLSFKPWI